MNKFSSIRRLLCLSSLALALPWGALAADIPAATPASKGMVSERLARIRPVIQAEIDAKRMPGAVVLIARKGAVVHAEAIGFQDPSTGKALKRDSLFRAYSMTKPLVSVLTMMMVEEGQLQLADPVGKFLPALSNLQVMANPADTSGVTVPAIRQITVQDLLRHTSGLTYGGRPDTGGSASALYPAGADLPSMNGTKEFISKIAQLPLVYQPGTVFEYSVSFEMLGAILEKVSNKSLDQYLRDTLWAPLNMVDTGFHIPESKKSRQARAFKLNPLDNKPQRIHPVEKDVTFECGGGCSLGTVTDYLKFGQMLVNGGALHGKRILSPQMVQLFTSNQLGKNIDNRVANVEPHRDGYGFGLGVAVRLEPGLAAVPGNVGEFSWNGSYGTAFFADPKEKLVVVFGTAAPGELRKYYREQVQDLIYGAMTR